MIDKDQIIKAQQEKIERVEKLQKQLHEMAMFGMLTIKVLGLNDKHGLNNNLITVRNLQVENKRLKAIIKQQNDLLKELSEENMDLGRSRRQYADTVAMQQRLLDVYQDMAE